MKAFFLFIFLSCMGLAIGTEFIPIQKDVFIHVSYMDYDGYRFPSNGLIVKTEKGYLIIDTAWDEKQTQEIIDFIAHKLKGKIVACIVTHAHLDRVAGVSVLRKNGVDVYSTEKTRTLSIEKGMAIGNKIIVNGESLIDGLQIDCEYYGPAHSPDNIVIYIKKYKIMYAGCIAKSLESKNIGNIEDSDIENWKIVIDKLLEIASGIEYYVIPGHGRIGKKELLAKTKELLENNNTE